MKKLIDFIRSTNAPVFGLIAMIFGLFQMYAKVYFAINPYPIHWGLDLLIALIVASGFAIATTIIIVHSANKNTPYMFAFFDFAGYVLYFGNNALVWYNQNDWAKIGGAVFIALLSAVIIYNFGEIFISQIRAKFLEIDKVNELNNQYANEKQELLSKIEKLENSKNEISEALQGSKNSFSNLEKICKELELQIQDLQSSQAAILSEKNLIEKELDTLNLQKAAFLQNTNKPTLKGSLDGKKRAFTKQYRLGNFKTAKKLLKEIIADCSILGIELEPEYLNHTSDLFSEKEVSNV